MKKCNRVLLIEDDPYARFWAEQMLSNHAVPVLPGRVNCVEGLVRTLRRSHVDIIVINPEAAVWMEWIEEFPRLVGEIGQARVLCAAARLDEAMFQCLTAPVYAGYLIKNELGSKLVDAVQLVACGAWVMTPGVQVAASRNGFVLFDPVVLSGSFH